MERYLVVPWNCTVQISVLPVSMELTSKAKTGHFSLWRNHVSLLLLKHKKYQAWNVKFYFFDFVVTNSCNSWRIGRNYAIWIFSALNTCDVHIVQTLTISLGQQQEQHTRHHSMATVCRLSRSVLFPPQFKSLQEWFHYAFANSEIDGENILVNNVLYVLNFRYNKL